MNTSRHIRLSFLTMFVLFLVVVLTSCSKKDVVSDEGLSEFGEQEDSVGEAISDEADVDSAAVPTVDSSGLQTVYFDFDQYSLRSDAREGLQANADWLKANPNTTVQLEGHCDERGTIEYNLALGERRANAAKDYLERLGVDPSRMSLISYGEERPSNPSSNEGAWSENRRAEFVVLSQ